MWNVNDTENLVLPKSLECDLVFMSKNTFPHQNLPLTDNKDGCESNASGRHDFGKPKGHNLKNFRCIGTVHRNGIQDCT
jgi:hypothetical protein